MLFRSVAGRRDAQRRQVSFETEFASRGELQEVKQQIHELDGDLRSLKQSIHDSGEDRRIRIEAKMESLREELGEKLHAVSMSVQELAVSASAMHSTIDAWKVNSPWKARP